MAKSSNSINPNITAQHKGYFITSTILEAHQIITMVIANYVKKVNAKVRDLR